MNVRSSLAGVIAALVLASSACAEPQSIDPALYVVRDRNSTMYLYGTVHVRPHGADWADQDVRDALTRSEEIWTELEISPESDRVTQMLAQEQGAAPQGRPLSSWLTQEENERLNALTQRLGLPTGSLEPLQPWLAALTLTLIPVMQAGYDPNSGVDRAIDAFGDSNGKTMRWFETPAQQIGFFANMSPELQREMLLEAIDEGTDAPAMLTLMSQAWERGDVETLERLVIDETREDYPELYQSLFVARNNAWVDVLVQELRGEGVDFVAVGAGHLIGDDGLVAQLRARGYRVQRVGSRR